VQSFGRSTHSTNISSLQNYLKIREQRNCSGRNVRIIMCGVQVQDTERVW